MNNLNKIHFIGIGGIGVSAIARMFLIESKQVSGSDRDGGKVTEELAKAGAKIFIGHSADNIPIDPATGGAGADLVIYTIAIPDDNPELARARELGIPTMTYPEALGAISAEKKTVAIAGTHGKTTTTAMIAEIVISAGLDPTVIVGSFLLGHESNFVAGQSDILIAEACEYKRSFLNLSPNILVITNVDEDHLDYYKDLADIQSAFSELVQKVPTDGFIICDLGDEKVKPVLVNAKGKIIDYKQFVDGDFKLKVPGEHNKKNAAAAIAAAECLGVENKTAEIALGNFRGTWRRFQYKGETKTGAIIYDDYAHHPTEIKATLSGTKEFFRDKKIIVFFQPHLYSRTKSLLDDFAQSFSSADQVFLLPIYAAREPNDPSISSDILADEINKNGIPVESLVDFDRAIEKAIELSGPDKVFLFVGAGDIASLAQRAVSEL